MGLPTLLLLKSNHNQKFLRFKSEKDVEVQGLLKFAGDNVASPLAKFKIERAKSGNGMVHIRSCYNNKYWVHSADQSPLDNLLVAASADQPEEDQTKSNCTLFKPSGASIIRLCHAKSGRFVCLSNTANPLSNSIHLGLADLATSDKTYEFTVLNWESIVILPKHAVFKFPGKGYLNSNTRNFHIDDFGDCHIPHEIISNADGSIRIKDQYHSQFWCCGPNQVMMRKDVADTDMCSFWPIKIDSNVIALRNIGSNTFCGSDENSAQFIAGFKSISKEARLVVEEVAISRSIFNVDFRLAHARIYNKMVLTMAKGEAINKTSQTNTVNLKLSYTVTKTNNWNASLSLLVGTKATFESGVPLVAKDTVEISAEFTGSYQWGDTVSSTNVVETIYKVSVPPMSRVKVSLLATEGTCDVPFSYDQCDLLTDGRRITYTKDDGVYTGVNCYNFKYEAKSYPLDNQPPLHVL